jgi:transcriptional regulator with XRE-family HTH domain
MRDNLRSVRRSVRLRVGRNVKQLRRLRGFSQERLAEFVGNTNKHIGQVERGEVNVGLDILSAIAAGLSVNVRDLFVGVRTGNAAATRVFLLTDRELDQLEQSLRTVRTVRRARQTPRRRK